MPQAKEIYKNRSKKCLWCNKEYRFFPYEEKTTKYCSRNCLGKATRTGKKHKLESIEKMRQSKIGKTVSSETREKIRQTLKNKGIKPPTRKGEIPWNKGKIHIAVRGEKNHNWRGGTMKWARQQVKVRDNYTCQICGLRDEEIIEVDHIKPIQKHNRHGFIDDMNNMQCLCPNCHRRKTNQFLKQIYTGRLLPTKNYV